MKFLKEIQKGENKKIEFKKDLSKNYNNFLKSVVAFANGSGGKIIFGVDNNKNIIGIKSNEVPSMMDKISNLITEKCYPQIIPEMYVKNIDGKILLIIEIYPGSIKPYSLKTKNGSKVYIRVGATTRLADSNVIKSLKRESEGLSYDEEILYSYSLQKTDFEEIKKDFLKETGKKLNINKLLNLKILKEENGKLFITRGGLLLSGNYKENNFYGIKCARFKGNNMDEFIDSKEYSGSLYKIVEEAVKFAKNHIEKNVRIEDLKNKKRYSVPITAIREGLVNAVVHRDYSINSDIKFAIFDNRIEITSPGGLPGNLDIETIKDGRSEIRNTVIARFFKEIGYIEEWGTGISRMINQCRKYGLKEPIFIDDGRYFKVILFRETKSAGMPEKSAGMPEKSAGMPEKSAGMPEKIKNFIASNGKITRKDIEHIFGVGERRGREILKKLRETNILEKRGNGKNTYYVLSRRAK